MTKSDGGPAFPRAGQVDQYLYIDQRGMSLRDYFAAAALPALIADAKLEPYGSHRIAESAYKTADAMLAARDRQDNRPPLRYQVKGTGDAE